MNLPPADDSLERAERVFLDWKERCAAGSETPIEDLCRAHPELRVHIVALAARYEEARARLEVTRTDAVLDFHEALLPGTRYEPRGELARGGMGIILSVFDPSLQRTIAVKVPRDCGEAPPAPLERIQQHRRLVAEAQVLARLDHPGVVPIHELGTDRTGTPFFTMRQIDGQDFMAVIRAHHEGDRAWRLPNAIGVLIRACEAVAYAHSKGILHGDLKPANVMVGCFGEVYVMDWGLARAVAPDPESSALPHTGSTPGAAKACESSSVLGTPGYIAPEMTCLGRRSDARADVYGLGATLCHLLSGQPPRDEPVLHSRGAIHRCHAPRAPEELVAICEQAMAEDPARRYASALELARELEAWRDGRVVRAHRTGAWAEATKWVGRNRGAAAAVAALVLGLGATGLVQTLLKGELGAQAEQLRREAQLSRITLASTAFSNGDIGHMQELLEDCPPDLETWEWRYLAQAADTSSWVLPLAGIEPHAACLLPGGRILTAGTGSPSRIGLWRAAQGVLEHELTLPEGCSINTVSFSADGSRLAVFGQLGQLLLWDTSGWSAQPSLPVELHGWHGVTFAPRGFVLAAYGTEGVELWDAASALRVARLSAQQRDIADVAWSPDGERLCAASWDGTLSVWDVAHAELIRLLRAGSARLQQVEWSPDGRWIAAGDWDSRLHVFDAHTLAPVYRSDRLGGHVLALAWNPASTLLAVGGKGLLIELFSAENWEPVGRLVGHTASVQSIQFSADGKTLLSTGDEPSARLWTLAPEESRRELHELGREPPAGVVFAGDGERVAVGWGNGVVEIWDRRRQRRVRRLEAGGSVRHLDWARESENLAVALWASDILLLDPEERRAPLRLSVTEPTEVHFDPSGTRVAATAQEGTLSVWDAASGALQWEVLTPPEQGGWPGNLFGASWSPDGAELLVSTYSGHLQVRDARDGALRRETTRSGMLFARFCNDGGHILAWAYSGSQGMELLDARTLEPLWKSRRTNHMWPVLAPDCSRVFSANWQGFLGVWDAHTGRLLTEIEGLPPGNPRLGISPDGECVVLATGDRLEFLDTRAR